MASSEVAPFAKTGGLGDVTAALVGHFDDFTVVVDTNAEMGVFFEDSL